MKTIRLTSLLLLLPFTPVAWSAESVSESPPFGLALHAGAGASPRNRAPEIQAKIRPKLREALDAGYAVLDKGGRALEAVTAVINILEDAGLFDAGRGSVLNAEGVCELDASIMNGQTLEAGAVACLHHIQHPINLARDVMEKSPHVMLVGEGAEKFARSLGYSMVPNEYFQTDEQRKALERAKEKSNDRKGASLLRGRDSPRAWLEFGTVGCAALDRQGNLAAGTSTGGLTNKKFGRVGDSPIIGAGTYANNATCAVSCTGIGEFFIRASAAADVSARMEYLGRPVREAAAGTLAKIAKLKGSGGLIALDAKANVAIEFNTPAMLRAWHISGKPAVVALYPDEAKN